ncbi:MAG: GNAT family N-acetyltransferase [Proteobacteria bacterium]|nr:GNAT family N-acetyltransferase [Pseudomonadota bacterium]MDA1070041.1 GNAT family N-acetyltransferase [Pseudomonadota bacterium]
MARFLLDDGTGVILRPLRPSDREAFLGAFRKLSDRSCYLRFHKLDPRLRERDIAYLTTVDQVDHVALAVFAPSGGIALGRFVRLPEEPATADLTLTVVDGWQRRGIAKLLLAALMARARNVAITSFTASVLDENRPARTMMAAIAAPLRREGSSWLYRLPTDPALLHPGPVADALARRDAELARRFTPNG